MTMNHTNTDNGVSDTLAGYGLSYAITSILSAFLVIAKESNESVHDFLVAITGHHWVTHGLLDVILFVVLGAILSRRHLAVSGSGLITAVVGSTILSGLLIAGFFVL